MKLSEQDAELFLDLMWALQYFVNQRLNILADVSSLANYAKCSAEEKHKVRMALYGDKTLIDAFVQENPQNFSKDSLAIVSNWKNYIKGDFQIERFLKRYAVLIKNDEVYGVLGLYQGLEELIHRSHLPLHIQTVLLPFKGTIVYDGLFQTFNITFGGGIKQRLKETYLRAKQNQRIIESLGPVQRGSQRKQPAKAMKQWKPELRKLADTAGKLRGGSKDPAIYSPAFRLVKASIEFAQLAVLDSTDVDSMYTALKKVERALRKSSTVFNRQDYR